MTSDVFNPDDYLYKDFDAVMRDNTTGETKTIHLDLWYDHSMFMWTEGNYSCDCNRSLFFYNHDRNKKYKCGFDKITVVKMIFPDGTEVLVDE